MKTMLKKRFKASFPKGSRLLAIHLNGFSHSVIYDNGHKADKILQEEFSGCMPEGSWGSGASSLFAGIGHSQYQNNPVELLYVTPDER